MSLATQVLRHALDNYDSGWDVVYECYSARELAELLPADVRTLDEAILHVFEEVVAPFRMREEEARADVFCCPECRSPFVRWEALGSAECRFCGTVYTL